MGLDALDMLRATRRNRGKRFPDRDDPRCHEKRLFPYLDPKFRLSAPAKVFTIGSCFARNIELALADYDIDMPTQRFFVPKTEWEHRPNGLLNEYNAGTISQRILAALGEKNHSVETIIETQEGFVDLLLPGGFPVTLERAVARRAEIDAVYEELVSSDLVVITLGLVEAWFDQELGLYLNRMPRAPNIRRRPGRYVFRRFDAFDALELLDRALTDLISAGVERILLTVSPVPMGTTFSGEDAVVANSYSKAVLRVCAEKLVASHPEVDYFPSYEIVTSGGLDSYRSDNIHVRDELVRRVTRYMMDVYFTNLVGDKVELERSSILPEAGP